MSNEKRIKGQEVVIGISGPQGNIGSIDAVQSFEVDHEIDILSEGYLGEVAERKDEIFMGISGKLEMHIAKVDYLRFMQQVIDKAQRRIPATTVFNITATLSFPDGRRARVNYRDVSFGTIPLNVGGRDEYVSSTLEFEGSSVRVLF